MTVQILQVFAVHGDGGERSDGPIEGYCATRAEAEIMCQGRGWYGGNGAITPASVLEVEGVLYALASPAPIVFMNAKATQDAADEAARARALAKLTPTDRRVLGIK